MSNRNELLRKIPKIDEMLLDGRLVFLLEKYPRAVIVDELRTIIDNIRKGILADEITEMPSVEDILAMLEKKTGANNQFSLRRVINATGVVLHTNIGRACLSDKVCDHIKEIAGHYSTLEYDLKKGARGSRHDHVEKIICKITGAEAAMVVNNNAAATMLCLAALAKEKEVIQRIPLNPLIYPRAVTGNCSEPSELKPLEATWYVVTPLCLPHQPAV